MAITITRGHFRRGTRKSLALVAAGLFALGAFSIGLPTQTSAAYAETTLDQPTSPPADLTTPSPAVTPPPATNPPSAVPPATAPPATAPPAGTPQITSPAAGIFIGRDSTTVTGTRDPGQEIQVFSTVGDEPACIAAADGTTTWTCEVRMPSGPVVPLRAVVTGNADLSSTITVAVLGAPVVVGGPNGQASSNGIVRGTGYPGATVFASVPSGAACTVAVDGAGDWVCALIGSMSSGTHAVSASQKTEYSSPSSSNTSAATSVQFDLDQPMPPVVTSPTSGGIVSLAESTYSGTGENGARVIVYAGAQELCSAIVSGETWACSTGAVPAGAYRVIAVQQDAAGNLSGGSAAVILTFATATSSASPSAVPAPVLPAEKPAALPLKQPRPPSATAQPSTTEPTPSSTADPVPPAGASGGGTLPPAGAAGGWSDPTRFATAIAPLGFMTTLPWLQAIMITGAVLLLLVAPALLLSGTISRARGGKPLWQPAKLSGRNRAAVEFETAPTIHISRPLRDSAAVIAAAALIVMSGPVGDQPAYLRLLIGAILAVAVVNAVSVLVPLWWSSRVLTETVSYRFVPATLFLVGAAALTSRFFDLNPAFLFGLLFTITVGTTAADSDAATDPSIAARDQTTRGRLAAVRAASLLILAVIGWLILPLLPPSTSVLATFGAEFVNILVLTALGSTAVVLIPLARTSGHSLLRWSPSVWALLAVSALTVLFVSLTPIVASATASGAAAIVWLSALGFALASVCIWAWYSYVAPIIR